MNEHVARCLNDFIECLDDEIDWHRKKMSELVTVTADIGSKLDKLVAERRAVLDHLEANK